MKNKTTRKLITMGALAMIMLLMSFIPVDDIITHEGDTTIINTTLLTKDVRGYRGTTPVMIFVKKNKVVRVVPLRNQETRAYFRMAMEMLPKWEGMSVSKAKKKKIDAVSGATMSSKALVKNVQMGLEYYDKNKKK